MSRFLTNLPNSVSVSIPKDADGYMGRECPKKECLRYFKVKPGTGLTGKLLPCHCPYCGHTGQNDTFWTPDQLKYAKSVAMGKIKDAIHRDLKKLEFDHPARGGFGIGMSLKVTAGLPHPIRYYREKKLETHITCVKCTLDYAIYGVFGYCPDCHDHNSLQILQKNLELAGKQLRFAESMEDADFKTHLIGDALENAVSAFDGFGRELAMAYKNKSSDPATVAKLSFQNLTASDTTVQALFGFTLSLGMGADWPMLVRCFQKRHLLAHKMGVIDDKYVASTGDPQAVVGRKVVLDAAEVSQLLAAVEKLGSYFATELTKRHGPL